jgi:hypothetical protein
MITCPPDFEKWPLDRRIKWVEEDHRRTGKNYPDGFTRWALTQRNAWFEAEYKRIAARASEPRDGEPYDLPGDAFIRLCFPASEPPARPHEASPPGSPDDEAALRSVEGIINFAVNAEPSERERAFLWAARKLRARVDGGSITRELAHDLLGEAARRAGLPSSTINSVFERGQL